MNCSYCNAPLQDGAHVAEGSLVFCNNLHRRFFHEMKAGAANPDSKASPSADGSTEIKKNLKGSLGQVIGTGIGMVLGTALATYTGMNAIFPILGGFLFYWLLGQVERTPKRYRLPLAIQLGHMTWMAMGLLVVGLSAQFTAELVVFFAAIFWLWFKPSLVPLVVLTVIQLGTLGINIASFVSPETVAETHKALLVHIVLRLTAVTLMWLAYREADNEPG